MQGISPQLLDNHWETGMKKWLFKDIKFNLTFSCRWEELLNSLYELLAAMLKGNRANCAKFSSHLDWLINQLEAQHASLGL